MYARAPRNVQKQIAKAGLPNATGMVDLSVLREPVLVINQKGKLVETRADFTIYDQNGRQLAAVRGKRMSSRVEVTDNNGRRVLELRREASLLKSKITVADTSGVSIGRIVRSGGWNQPDREYKLESILDDPIGEVYGEDRRDQKRRHRHREFNVQDARSTVVARISKTHAGLAKELFTKGDNYVVSFEGPVTDPLRLLSIATTLVIDGVFHQG